VSLDLIIITVVWLWETCLALVCFLGRPKKCMRLCHASLTGLLGLYPVTNPIVVFTHRVKYYHSLIIPVQINY